MKMCCFIYQEERNANRKEKMRLEGQIESLDHELKIKTKSLEEKTVRRVTSNCVHLL